VAGSAAQVEGLSTGVCAGDLFQRDQIWTMRVRGAGEVCLGPRPELGVYGLFVRLAGDR
jgi:hypothetical protein